MKSMKHDLCKMGILAAASVVLMAPAVRATTVSVNGEQDLVLGFVATSGTGQGSNLEVDLGQINQFTAGGTYATGSAVSLNGSAGLAVADLIAVYGSGWASNVNLSWGAVASADKTTGLNGFSKDTLWATQTLGSFAAPGTTSSQANGATAILGLYSGSAGKSLNQLTQVNSTVSGVATYGGAGDGTFQGQLTRTASLGFSYFGGSFPVTLGVTGAGQMELVEFNPGTAGVANTVDLGTLALDNAGDLTFTSVPEPSTWALVAGGLGMLMVVRRTKKSITA